MDEKRPSIRRPMISQIIFTVVFFFILRLVSGHGDWTRAWVYVVFVLALQLGSLLYLNKVNPEMVEERRRPRQGTKNFDKILAPAVALAGPIVVWVVAS